MVLTNLVSLENGFAKYPAAPFNPPIIFPEFSNSKFIKELDEYNTVYGLVRQSLINLGLDKENVGSVNWNPFKNIIKEDCNVVLKPNMVLDKHTLGFKGVLSMITHASVLRPIIDYILLTGKKCNIVICDVPLQEANWTKLLEINGLNELKKYYDKKKINISILDLRLEIAKVNLEGVIVKRIKKRRDPKGYTPVNLAKKSYIQDIIKDYKKLEITDYGVGTVAKHHNPKKNEYLVPNTILESDVFINFPKLKTHKKAGVTLSMKNLIGINGDKSWIAHHRRGVDEYPSFNFLEYIKWKLAHYSKAIFPSLARMLFKIYYILFKRTDKQKLYKPQLMEGNWYGNDTVWRTILDLNNIIFFSDKKGVLKNKQQRFYLSVIDGIIGMDKEGPMHGEPFNSGLIVAGFHPVSVDFVGAQVMGFNPDKIPQIKNGLKEKYFGLTNFKKEDIFIKNSKNKKIDDLKVTFNPSKGWQGHM